MNHSLLEQQIKTSVMQLASLLLQRQWRMATAESCTGGMVAQYVTDLAGSSAWFDRALITYSNQAKQDLLAVDAQIFSQFGAVSQECVESMVTGCLQHSGVDVAVAISGIAGPTGGRVDKPVGTVWIAWADRYGKLMSHRYGFCGDRHAIRLQATQHALRGLVALFD